MRRLALPALVASLAVVLSGCVGTDAVERSQAELETSSLPNVVTHGAAGLLPLDPAFSGLKVRLAATGFNGAEPTIGVAKDGTIFTSGPGASILRSKDDGKTWQNVNSPIVGPRVSLDPWIWLDPWTDRVFNAPLYVACTWAAWSDDLGEKWDANPITGCGLPAHDHQKLTSGPPAQGVQTRGYKNVVYYAYNSFRMEGSWVSRSLDGGRTYEVGQMVLPRDCHSGVNGPIAVAADGTAILPKAACEGVRVGVTHDSGKTWKAVDLPTSAGVARKLAYNPDVAFDTEGNAYLVWQGKDALLYLSVSRDRGLTWSEPIRASPPGITSTIYSVVVAGSPGRIAIGYLGTDADSSKWKSPEAQDADDKARWNLLMTYSTNALDADPTFTTVRVTPEDDPVQIGCVWLSGGSSPCRNMLDFIDMTQHEGHPYLIFTDGCTDSCAKNPSATASNSRSRMLTVMIERTGPNLYVEGDMPYWLKDAAPKASPEAPAVDLGRVLKS
jgi:photosystem II stability/assembly factor-like uncharacterized protein